MLGKLWDVIEDYALENTSPVSENFDRLRDETLRTMEAPQMQVGAVEGTLLRLLVKLSGAKSALEIGMFTGYSGLMIASALPDDGTLVTCDINPKAEEVARRYFTESPHGQKISIRMGPALDTIASLPGPFDFVFIDADKENYVRYWDAVVPKVRPGGLIVADNVLWSGRVVLANPAESTRAIQAFNEHVRNDDRVEQVMLTVRDGMTLALRK